jgi:predicted nucleic acid-binding protein
MLDAHVIADRVSAADAFYVALARVRRIELWTTDAGLERGAAGLANVRLIA